ncbi:MAG: patatin-like phospholipase family protein [Hyphomicrobiaceae bacterium]|nr:patatin-like phospholipase family protein [Hyphomicrobiaceae bacterium]
MACTKAVAHHVERSALQIPSRLWFHLSWASMMFVLAGMVSGCAATSVRLPAVPLAKAAEAAPLGIVDARFYMNGDKEKVQALAHAVAAKGQRALAAGQLNSPPNQSDYLAISGGGDDGAFGAGLLLGWTERGDRPTFAIVTGISTGALSAPFAFLGPEYDARLKAVYTDVSAEDIFTKRPVIVAALADDAMTDTTPLRKLIARNLDQEMVRRIGEEYDKGRLLLIATTNLDQSQSVVWNIGALAKSGDPRARELIIDVLMASAALPGVFPPVMLDIVVDGHRYQEMHVDGGAVAQSFLYPTSFSLKWLDKKMGLKRKRSAYVIRNGRLSPPEDTVKRQTLSIVGQTVSTMIASSGVNDSYRIYLETKRDGVGFNLAFIGDDFTTLYSGPFDKAYMRKLFAYGFEKGKAGYRWHAKPPDYAE